MKVLDSISEELMVVKFLQGEFNSKRYGSRIANRLNREGKDKSLIFSPDLSDTLENKYRKSLLDYRGFRNRTNLFTGFPEDVSWQEVELCLSDLQQLFVLREEDKWVCYTGGTRKIVDTLKYYDKNPSMEEAEHIQQCLRHIRNGDSFPEVILVGEDKSRLVILEGHVRIMAYLLHCAPDIKVKGIVGLSGSMPNWLFF